MSKGYNQSTYNKGRKSKYLLWVTVTIKFLIMSESNKQSPDNEGILKSKYW